MLALLLFRTIYHICIFPTKQANLNIFQLQEMAERKYLEENVGNQVFHRDIYTIVSLFGKNKQKSLYTHIQHSINNQVTEFLISKLTDS